MWAPGRPRSRMTFSAEQVTPIRGYHGSTELTRIQKPRGLKLMLGKLFTARRTVVADTSPATVLSRVKALIQANIDELINRAQDPEKIVKEIIADYEAALTEAKAAVSDAISVLRDIQGKQYEDETEVALWRERAELAAARATALRLKDLEASGKAERMTLTALQKERTLQIRIDMRRESIDEQTELVDNLKTGISRMQDNYELLQDKLDSLISRSRFASAKETVVSASKITASPDATNAISALERKVKKRESAR